MPTTSNINNPPAVPGAVLAGVSQPAMCAGDRATLVASGGNGNYTWAPNVALSATTGATVVASPPAGYTRYTVTSTNPTTGAVTTATIAIMVRENCCPVSKGDVVEITGSVFNTGTGSPFAGYPVGTRFHFGGASPIRLQNLAYQPPMGSVILMDGGQDLVLENGASLALTGVSITAACDAMWGRLWVRNTAVGVSSTFTDGAAGNPNVSTANPLPGATTLYNQLSHSLGGIDFEQPLPTVLNSSGAVNVPYCKLTAVDFLHNEQSVVLHRSNYGTNQVGGTTYTYLSFCNFNALPASFKSPKLYAVGTPDYPHYSTYQVLYTGQGGHWYGNTHQNALFGAHNPDDGAEVGLKVVNSRFSNCYLAGINSNASFYSGMPAPTAGGSTVNSVSYCTFEFPTILALPATPQFANAIANDVLDRVAETRGVCSYNARFYVNNSVFNQANDPYPDFTFAQRTTQIGVKARRGYGNNNRFNLLHVGIKLTDIVLLPYPANTGFPIQSNVFTACAVGLAVGGNGLNRGTGGLCPCPPPASVSLSLTCNTFDRGNATRPGQATGIFMETSSGATFDPLTGVAPPLGNKFLDYGTRRAGFLAIVKPLGCCTASNVRYTTFSPYLVPSSTQGTMPFLPGHTNLVDLCSGINLSGSAATYVAGQNCGFSNPGLERTALPVHNLEVPVPNPATERATLAYHLPHGAQAGALHIQRSLGGEWAKQIDLPASDNGRHDLDVKGWLPGVYFVALYADGVLVQTRRLQVQ